MTDVRTATSDDLEMVATILADAFFDDPVMAWIFPDLTTRRRLGEASYRFMAERGYLPHGHSHVIADVAAALWLPAGTTLGDEFWSEHGRAYAEAVEWNVERGQRFAEATASVHPADPHRYLLAIGVRASAQGRGLGGALLEIALAQADASGEPAYLEATSPGGRALYRRHGFEVTGEISIGGGPTLWPMWREPRGGRPT